MRRLKLVDDLSALVRGPSAEDFVCLEIDGRALQVRTGTTLLELADQAGRWIPRLCHLPGAPLRAACRLCLVSVDDMNGGLVNACGTVVREGMVIRTQTPQIQAVRRTIMELTLLEHGRCGRPECEVEALAERLGALHSGLPELARHSGGRRGSDYISFDPALCVLCDRCVRICPLSVPQRAERGSSVTIAFDGKSSPADSSCSSCGDCIAACPSGALRATTQSGKQVPYPDHLLHLATASALERALRRLRARSR